MIEIDGSIGEGGGQMLRTALSLSAVLGEDVRIFNIRAGRQNPGLAPQHVTCINAVREISDGTADGAHKGSKEVVFRPGKLLGGEFEFDVGTAGSVSLVLQCCLLPAAMSKGPVSMVVRGGTDVRWSPPVDYFTLVYAPMVRLFGVRCEVDVVSRGFYPEGGGELRLELPPAGGLAGAVAAPQGSLLGTAGIAYSQNLPGHITDRMKHVALKTLIDLRNVKIESDTRSGRSTGTGIVLAATFSNTVLGASALGEKGVRAETLGETCARDLLETVKSGATVDEHMLDQILPYMALANGPSSVLAEEVTGHAETNMWVIERFLGPRFQRKQVGGLVEISTG